MENATERLISAGLLESASVHSACRCSV